jgi:hypothetical protein
LLFKNKYDHRAHRGALRYTELKKYWFGHFSWPSLLGGELITLYPVKALLLNASKLRVLYLSLIND